MSTYRKFAYIMFLMVYGAFSSLLSGQESTAADWNWTESTITVSPARDGHHLFLDKFGDRLYFRGGDDEAQTIEVYSWSREHLNTVQASLKFGDKALIFDRLLESGTGLIGIFKWVDRDNSQLEVYSASLREDAFTNPSLLLTHNYLKVVGAFKNAYPVTKTHIFTSSTCDDYFVSAEDLSFHLYTNRLAPIGYSNKVNREIEGRYFALLDANFELIREWTIPDSPEFKISEFALSSEGVIYFKGSKEMKLFEKNEELAGKKGPNYYLYFGIVEEEGYTTIPLGLAKGYQATNFAITLEEGSSRFMLTGFYTDGMTSGNMTGLFVARGEGGEMEEMTASELPAGFSENEVIVHKSKLDGWVHVIKGEKIVDYRSYSSGLRLKSYAQRANGETSLVFEFDNTYAYTRYGSYRDSGGTIRHVNRGTNLANNTGSLFFVTLNQEDELVDINLYHKYYYSSSILAVPSMIWQDDEFTYACFMNLRSRKEIKTLSGDHNFGELLEYGKWDRSGELVDWRILQSGIKNYSDVPLPQARQGQEVLFESFNLHHPLGNKIEPYSFRLAQKELR